MNSITTVYRISNTSPRTGCSLHKCFGYDRWHLTRMIGFDCMFLSKTFAGHPGIPKKVVFVALLHDWGITQMGLDCMPCY